MKLESMIALVALVVLVACPAPPRTEKPAAETPSAAPPAASETPATPDSAAALEGTEWALAELDGQPVAAGEAGKRAGFHLVADGHKVQGNAGCNRMMGTYQLEGGSLKFGPLATTKMACPEMETEGKFLKAIGATTRYEIAGSKLTLFAGDTPVARLEAAS